MSSAYEGTSPWCDLQISPNPIGFMPYRDYHITIYEGLSAMKPGSSDKGSVKYYCTPIVLLNPSSAKYQYNQVTDQHVVLVDVVLWDKDIENSVVHFMKNSLNIEIDESQVQVIPFQELVLKSNVASGLYQCPSNWQLYQLHNIIKFKLTCASKSKGLTLERLLKNDPEQFTSVFNVKFSLATKKSQRQEALIRLDTVLYSNMFAKLDQRFPTTDEVLLTLDDAKQLIAESASTVILETLSDDEVISSASESEIHRILENLMIAGRQAIDGQSASAWDSVFWNDDNCRPDRVAATMNELFNKTDKKNQARILQTMSDSKKTAAEIGSTVAGFGFKLSDETWHASSSGSEREESVRILGETLSKIAWNGEEFVPKPIQMTRVNLANVRNRQSDVKTTITYTPAMLTLPVNIPTSAVKFDAYEALERRLNEISLAHQSAVEKKLDQTEVSAEQQTDSTGKQNSIEEKLNATAAILEKLLKKIAKDENSFVHFNVCRSTKVDAIGCISYNQIKLNKNNCLDTKRGHFTAPASGHYFFAFHGTKLSPDTAVSLVVNGSAYTSTFSGTADHGWHMSQSLSAVLSLKKGDWVAVYLNCGSLDGQVTKSLGGQSVCLANPTSFSGFSLRP